MLEKSEYMGGISRTVNYKGNRIDIGGHRFFSKSDRVMDWWRNVMPVQSLNGKPATISYQRQTTTIEPDQAGGNPESSDLVMLVRERNSRIYFMRKFFTYPISLSADTVMKLGLLKTIRIGLSYLHAVLFPIRNESNLEQFFINRFGRELYLTFFKSYTEKVWGVDCKEISAEWGAQRIKGLSILKTITRELKKLFDRRGVTSAKMWKPRLLKSSYIPSMARDRSGKRWHAACKAAELRYSRTGWWKKSSTTRSESLPCERCMRKQASRGA